MLCRLPRSRRIPAIACAPSPRYRSDSSSSTSSSSSCAPLADVFAASVAETSRVPITKVAHEIWRRQRREPGDDYVDLTVGHAKDTVVLARMANEGEGGGRVFGFDIQNIDNASANLKSELSPSEYGSVELHEMCHSLIQDVLPPAPESRVAIVVGNLGYLPGAESDKTVKTQPETTIVALRQAAALLRPGGIISLLCYVGHEGGALEHQSVLKEAERLQDSGSYSFYHFDRSPLCPKLVIVQKNCVN